MRTLKVQGIDIYKTSPSKYTVKYGGEDFVFSQWQDVLGWVQRIVQHERKNGYSRSQHGLEKLDIVGGSDGNDDSSN